MADSASPVAAASTQHCPQQDLLPLILQLLAALLLELCAARPAVGDLDSSLAADSALVLLQVCLGDVSGGVGWRGSLCRTVVWCGGVGVRVGAHPAFRIQHSAFVGQGLVGRMKGTSAGGLGCQGHFACRQLQVLT
jgi:hypothetical protein